MGCVVETQVVLVKHGQHVYFKKIFVDKVDRCSFESQVEPEDVYNRFQFPSAALYVTDGDMVFIDYKRSCAGPTVTVLCQPLAVSAFPYLFADNADRFILELMVELVKNVNVFIATCNDAVLCDVQVGPRKGRLHLGVVFTDGASMSSVVPRSALQRWETTKRRWWNVCGETFASTARKRHERTYSNLKVVTSRCHVVSAILSWDLSHS